MTAYICVACHRITDIDECGINLKDAKCPGCGCNYLWDIDETLTKYLNDVGITNTSESFPIDTSMSHD